MARDRRLRRYRSTQVRILALGAISRACVERCPGKFSTPAVIWLTPVWRSDRSWNAARSSPHPSLHIVGLADHHYHDAERHAEVSGETVGIADADHRLEVAGDIFATLDAWRTMAEAVVRFAARR